MTLIHRILKLAEMWSTARGHSTTARLSTIVARDGGLLKRLEEGGGCTVATLDKFVRHFRDPGQWPDGEVPAAATALLDEIGHLTTLPNTSEERDAA